MEIVDDAARRYSAELLSSANQKAVAEALKGCMSEETNQIKDFQVQINRQIEERQVKIDALMDNSASGVLPTEVVSKIGNKIKTLTEQIKALETAEPPKDYTVPQIKT